MKMLLPFTLLCVLTACAEDPHIAEISGLRAIIAQNDIDRAKAAEECGIVREDYEQAKRKRDQAWSQNQALRVFALELVKARGWKVDEVWVCRPQISDTNPEPYPPYILTEWNQLCDSPVSFRFIYDAAGNPSFEPEEG